MPIDPTSAFLNPDLYCQLTLEVEHADGSVSPVAGDGVILRAGANLALTVLTDEDVTELGVDQSADSANPYFKQKYEALKGLSDANDPLNPITGPYPDPITGVTPVGDPWSFTRESLWFGAVNDTPADAATGAFFFVVGRCGVAGSFPTPGYGDPELSPATLRLFDICAPCVDCPTWERVDQYVRRLVDFYNYLLELVYNEDTATPPVHPDGGTPEINNGLLRQYMTATRFWDYLVHNSTIKLAAQASGQAVITAAFYRNITAIPVAGVTISLEYKFFKNGVPWTGAVDPTVVSAKLLARSDVDMNAVYDGPLVWNADGVTVNLQAPAPLLSNKSLYGDVVLLLDNTLVPADNTTDEYHILLTATFTNTHLGVVQKEVLIYFMPLLGSSP